MIFLEKKGRRIVPRHKRKHWRLGLLLKEARKKERLTQAELASDIGASASALCSWEKGYFAPSDRQLSELLHALPNLNLVAALEALYPEAHQTLEEREDD